MGQVGARTVGRDAERSVLAAALERAGDAPELVLLTGEAGIGKSRLLSDTAEAAGELGWRVLVGHCLPLTGGGLPYGPWTQALRRLARTEGRPALMRLVGDDATALSPVLPLAVAGAPPPTAHVLEALLALVEQLAMQRPLLLGLEDLHWADPPSLDALTFLLRNLADVPLLVLATSRTDEALDGAAAAPLVELRRAARTTVVELEPLGVEATAALVAALGDDSADAAALHRRTGGNPYYLTELVKVGAGTVTSLDDVVLARLDGLTEGARRVLEALAVAGRPTRQPLLRRVTGLGEQELTAALRGLAARRLLGTTDDGAHLPAHALAAEAVLAHLLPGQRVALHTAYADALDEDPSLLDDVASVVLARAEHRAAGPDPAAAVRAATAAAAQPGAAAPAVLHWGRVALARWEQLPDAEQAAGCSRGALLELVAEAALRSGDPVGAVALVQEALDAPDAARPDVAGHRAERLAHYLWSAGRSAEAAQANRRALDLLGTEPTAALARAQASYASTLMVMGEWQAAEAACEQAISTAEKVGAATEQAHALATWGVVAVSCGDDERGLASLEAGCALARETADVRLLWRNLLNAAYALKSVGRLEEAAAHALEAHALAERHGFEPAAVRAALANAVSPLVDLGRWDQADALLASAPPGAADDPRVRLLERVAASVQVARGTEVPPGVLDGEEVEPRMRQQRDQVVAERALWAGDPQAALRAVEQALDVEGSVPDLVRLRATGLAAAADLLSLPVGAGGPGPQERAALLERVEGWVASLPTTGSAEVEALVRQAHAEASRARAQDTPAQWREVVAAWDALDRPYSAAIARWRLAECAAGHGESPQEPLRDAHAVALRLGAAPLRRVLELLALRTRTPLAASVPVPQAADPTERLSLTRRERQVLELLATGASNRRIGRQLCITENTAGVHVSNVLRKLGVANRSEATAVAHRLGLAPTEGGTA